MQDQKRHITVPRKNAHLLLEEALKRDGRTLEELAVSLGMTARQLRRIRKGRFPSKAIFVLRQLGYRVHERITVYMEPAPRDTLMEEIELRAGKPVRRIESDKIGTEKTSYYATRDGALYGVTNLGSGYRITELKLSAYRKYHVHTPTSMTTLTMPRAVALSWGEDVAKHLGRFKRHWHGEAPKKEKKGHPIAKKKIKVLQLLREENELSDREIAELCGVTRQYVKVIRKQL